MSLRLGSPDLLPYVCGVYVCSGCGGAVTRHGRDCAELPAGWVEARGEGEADADYVCPHCAPAASADSSR